MEQDLRGGLNTGGQIGLGPREEYFFPRIINNQSHKLHKDKANLIIL